MRPNRIPMFVFEHIALMQRTRERQVHALEELRQRGKSVLYGYNPPQVTDVAATFDRVRAEHAAKGQPNVFTFRSASSCN